MIVGVRYIRSVVVQVDSCKYMQCACSMDDSESDSGITSDCHLLKTIIAHLKRKLEETHKKVEIARIRLERCRMRLEKLRRELEEARWGATQESPGNKLGRCSSSVEFLGVCQKTPRVHSSSVEFLGICQN